WAGTRPSASCELAHATSEPTRAAPRERSAGERTCPCPPSPAHERRVALTPRDDLEELAVVVDDVELSAGVLAEGDDVVEGVARAGSELGRAVGEVLGVAAAHPLEGPDEALAVVRVEIRAGAVGQAAAEV